MNFDDGIGVVEISFVRKVKHLDHSKNPPLNILLEGTEKTIMVLSGYFFSAFCGPKGPVKISPWQTIMVLEPYLSTIFSKFLLTNVSLSRTGVDIYFSSIIPLFNYYEIIMWYKHVKYFITIVQGVRLEGP